MSYAVGSLVKARRREWVVLPGSTDDLILLRPLGGTEDEVTGIYTPLERVEPARFDLPDPTQPGDYRSCRLLRDAIKLGFRSSAGPFRCFGKIAVEPRPYQLVPLLMALKLDPVRLLIADDVGIGKTIEACLIAREMIDRGEVERLAVLCPPALAEQWQSELREKFHLEAELVLPSTASRLERNCRVGQSLFDLYPMVIVSMDFIKSDRRRDEFLRTCPELVIVDEAHTCAADESTRSTRHQRHELVKGLASDKNRHLILVTATPHSGKEAVFRSLLALLDPDFANLPQDLSGKENETHRRRLAAYFVQRRRGDIQNYLDAKTSFPLREEVEVTYKLSQEYRSLFTKVLEFARQTVIDAQGSKKHHQRVQWWSALALLRSLASSPAAAAATLRARAAVADTETAEDADEVGRRTVLDLMDDESIEAVDVVPGSNTELDEAAISRRRLLELAREAEGIKGAKDEKIKKAIKILEELISSGYSPIVFCRFIDTAEYVADQIRSYFKKSVEVIAVTGNLPPAEREQRVRQLEQSEKRILVCTDCLSEGINLQERFDAVFHYDLSWNPTRHEQREGRVDRFGQPREKVRVVTYYGTDNQIDGIVLDVLIRKHKAIRHSLGISVPVPVDPNSVIEAIFEGLLLRGESASAEQQLLFEDFFKPKKEDLFNKWDSSVEREKRSRTVFAQETIKVEEVVRELDSARKAVGSGVDVAFFTKEVLKAHRAVVSNGKTIRVDLKESPRALREAIGNTEKFQACFELPAQSGQIYLSRTHPIVEGLASHVLDTALDSRSDSIARRCGVIRTRQVSQRTTVLLSRFRFHIITRRNNQERQLLAEDCQLLAFAGSSTSPEWLDASFIENLVLAEPDGNVVLEQAIEFLRKLLGSIDSIHPYLEQASQRRAKELLEAHRRVRVASRSTGVSHSVEPQLPVDLLGVYIYLPLAKTT